MVTIDLQERLKVLGYVEGQDFVTQDDGKGPYIKTWLSPKPRPTTPQLERVTSKQISDQTELTQFNALFNESLRDKVLIQWIASRTGGGSPLQWYDELFQVWKTVR
ncbi:MAG: hypothetical protein E6Q97_09150 [Desulfurellales bacterium]|nr:MAG: hypothetical protein E6Q97_09150 [Desulfurellales bacterium]